MQIQTTVYTPTFRPASGATPPPAATPGDTFESGEDQIRFVLKHTVCGAAIGAVGLGTVVGVGAALIASAAGAPIGGAIGAGLLASVPSGIYGGIGGAILGTGVGMVRLLLQEA
ncbi:MAG: hypothetical protein AB1758_14010 [Candidatus Eremiobacterota bacterium]